MYDRDHGNAGAFLLVDQTDHHLAIGRIERCGRLIQQQDRMIGNEAARDIDALLLTAGEGRGRQRPQPLRNIETLQQLSRLPARLVTQGAGRDQGLCDHIDGRNARHRAQELADIADRRAADTQDIPGFGLRQIDLSALMTDADAAAIATIIAENHLQDRRLSRARRSRQDHAFAGLDLERHAAHHG